MRITQPERVRALLESAESVGYRVAWTNTQNKTLYLDSWSRWPLGGWDTRAQHWYVAIRAVGGQGNLIRILEDAGFRQGNRRRGSNPWEGGKKEVTETFRYVIAAVTGVPIPGDGS